MNLVRYNYRETGTLNTTEVPSRTNKRTDGLSLSSLEPPQSEGQTCIGNLALLLFNQKGNFYDEYTSKNHRVLCGWFIGLGRIFSHSGGHMSYAFPLRRFGV